MQQYIMGLVGAHISVSFLFSLFQLLKFVVSCQTTTQAISLGKRILRYIYIYIYVHIKDMCYIGPMLATTSPCMHFPL